MKSRYVGVRISPELYAAAKMRAAEELSISVPTDCTRRTP